MEKRRRREKASHSTGVKRNLKNRGEGEEAGGRRGRGEEERTERGWGGGEGGRT